jgi:hypothetical protein
VVKVRAKDRTAASERFPSVVVHAEDAQVAGSASFARYHRRVLIQINQKPTAAARKRRKWRRILQRMIHARKEGMIS